MSTEVYEIVKHASQWKTVCYCTVDRVVVDSCEGCCTSCVKVCLILGGWKMETGNPAAFLAFFRNAANCWAHRFWPDMITDPGVKAKEKSGRIETNVGERESTKTRSGPFRYAFTFAGTFTTCFYMQTETVIHHLTGSRLKWCVLQLGHCMLWEDVLEKERL